MNQIKAIIFDADGPLYQRTSDNTQANIALPQDFGFEGEYSSFVEAYNKEIHQVYDRSESVVTLFQHVFAQLGIRTDDTGVESFIGRFYKIRAQISPSPHAIDTLRWFHENGYKICVLTDHYLSSEGLRDWFEKLSESAYIDDIVSSFDTKHLKGSPEAYQECLLKLSFTPSEVVFVGHQQYEMDGAKKAGVTSICLASIAIPVGTNGDHTINSLGELPSLIKQLNGI